VHFAAAGGVLRDTARAAAYVLSYLLLALGTEDQRQLLVA
jgi:hypothetical protein